MKYKSEKIPEADSAPRIDLKMELLLKIFNDFKLYANFAKSYILDVSLVLSSPLTTINQTFLSNNKIAISRFSRRVALTTHPGFYLFKVNNRKTKNNGTRREMSLKLTGKTPERHQ